MTRAIRWVDWFLHGLYSPACERLHPFIAYERQSDGTLWLDIRLEVEGWAVRSDRLTFSIPYDIRYHNDSVAAAVMTLIGDRAERVEFNFAVSRRCADSITSYYAATEVEPVDHAMEPRQRGVEIG